MGRPAKKEPKPPLPEVVESVFLHLVLERIERMKKHLRAFSHEELLNYAAQLFVYQWLTEFNQSELRKVGAKLGGRQSDWRVHLARYWATIAVVSLHCQKMKVTEKLIIRATEEFEMEAKSRGLDTNDLGKKKDLHLDVSYAAKQELRAYNLWKKGHSNHYDFLKDVCQQTT